ncbi:tubulin polyglutamylase TTLL11 [Brachionus plicatilis]|uniref:Tubulin polyglutamylase TTLL11 n=1 Tax=Brachionus plicatilis TaxID=10195 RepID=A0A3M7RZS1_BRAPC|nr:tubulin polyglutamylase TTLL11 [Brachionus plicatilis]
MNLSSHSESDLASIYSSSFIDESLSSDSESNLSCSTTKNDKKSILDYSSVFEKGNKKNDENCAISNQNWKNEEFKKNETNKINPDSKSVNGMEFKMLIEEKLKQIRPLSTSKSLVKPDLRRIKSSVGMGAKFFSNSFKSDQKIELAKNFDYLAKKPPIFRPTLNESTIDLRASETIKSKLLITSKSKITVDTSKARSNTEVLKLCIAELGWQECPSGLANGCDIIWQSCASHEGRDQNSFSCFSPDSRLNKFPSMNHLLKKGPLTHSLNVMRRFYPSEFNFYPKTWFLPEQLKEFSQECRFIHDQDSKMKKPLTTFIVKPNDGSQGDGIYLISSPSGYLNPKTDNPKSYIVQEYVHNPFLIDGLKSDFRIYVVILKLKPLEIYIYDEGLVRFATIDYQKPDINNLNQIYMHLTNYSLNKKNDKYQFSSEKIDDQKLAGQGSKRKLSKIYSYMSKIGINVAKIKNEIDDLIIKTVFALIPEIKVELTYEIYNSPSKQRPSSFQVIYFFFS